MAGDHLDVNGVDDAQKRETAREESRYHADPQGDDRERADPMPAEVDHLLQCVLGRAAEARPAFVGDTRAAVPNPLHDTPQEQSLLPKLEDIVEHLAVEKTEVGHAALEVDAAQPRKKTVKPPRGEPLEEREILGVDANSPDDLVAVAPLLDQFGNHHWRMLKIGIHREDRCAARTLQSGEECILMTEVAREPHGAHTGVTLAHIGDRCPRLVGAPVIGEDDFPRHPQRGQHSRELVVQFSDVPFLVIRRNDNGQSASCLARHQTGPVTDHHRVPGQGTEKSPGTPPVQCITASGL